MSQKPGERNEKNDNTRTSQARNRSKGQTKYFRDIMESRAIALDTTTKINLKFRRSSSQRDRERERQKENKQVNKLFGIHFTYRMDKHTEAHVYSKSLVKLMWIRVTHEFPLISTKTVFCALRQNHHAFLCKSHIPLKAIRIKIICLV